MSDIIEDEDENEIVSGLPAWSWAGIVIALTFTLLAYILYS